ncbi:MAG: TlpA disulfide reductase family protein [Dehalococcoidia bacterium]|nr:TlpA disulfide reductase family protein [Dehalococcoidia bacterium]MDZ4247004.1 TlpA disulfide reductase family protein [Dehalococcoidia bacterium]
MFTHKLINNGILTAVLAALVLFSACGPSSGRGSPGGQPAPDFTLTTLDGGTVTLSALRGQPVLLNFWATWCPPCRQEMPLIQAIFEEKKDSDLHIVAVDIGEDLSTVKKFIEDEKLGFTIALDYRKQVAQTYGIQAIPTSFLIDREGRIIHTKVGAFNSRAEIRNLLGKIM